jgi:hypothetical protein
VSRVPFSSVEELQAGLRAARDPADRGLAIFLSQMARLRRLEELARALGR